MEIIREYLKKPEIIDIILFGSLVKGKEEPEDIDLLVIYTPITKNIIEMNHGIRKKLEKILEKIEITGKRYDEIFNAEFLARQSILSEGFSMRKKKFLSESLGYKNLVLFRYNLKNMNKSKRMQFYYALNGRNNEAGILKKNKCYKFSERILICQVESTENIETFFKIWKIDYIEFPIIIPERIIKYALK